MRSGLLYEPGDAEFVVNPDLTINHDMEVVKDYVAEVRAIHTPEDIRRLVEKWSGLIPECKPLLEVGHNRLPHFIAFLHAATPDKDGDWVAAQDRQWMCALVPPSTIKLVGAAQHFGVTTGLVILQLLGNDCYEVEQDGDKRILRLALPKRNQPQAETTGLKAEWPSGT